MTRDELRNAINNACDIMRREGLTTMDYMEQLSWLLFLKSFEETQQEIEAMTGTVLERALRTAKVDLSKTAGPSTSGKSIIIASTKGNQPLPEPHSEVKVGLNVYKVRS